MRSAAVADRVGDQAEAVVDGAGDLFPPAGMSVGDALGSFVGAAFTFFGIVEPGQGVVDDLVHLPVGDGFVGHVLMVTDRPRIAKP